MNGFIENKLFIDFSVEFYYQWIVLSYWRRLRNILIYGGY